MWLRPCLTHPTLLRALTWPPGNKIKDEGQRKPHKHVPRQMKPQRPLCIGDQPPGHLCVLVAQSCPTLCDPMDCSPPGSSVHGILQERTLEWVAISSPWRSTPPRSRPHNLASLASPVFANGFFTTSTTWEDQDIYDCLQNLPIWMFLN